MVNTPGPVSPTPSRGMGWTKYLAGAIVALLVAGLVGAVAAGPLVLTHRQDLPLERAFGKFAVTSAAWLSAGTQTNPVAGDTRAAQTGRSAYTGSCSQCHGATGDGKGVLGQATYPPATDLTGEDAQELSDAELFWILKNGLSFTGMPGYADQYPDNDLWSIVSYLKTLKGGQGQAAVAVPTPSVVQLSLADPRGDAPSRGAAQYFALDCAACHGPVGDAPGNLRLRGGGEMAQAIRGGRRGMPAYGTDVLSDAQLSDLAAYVSATAGAGGGGD